jgi:hypothetical protein
VLQNCSTRREVVVAGMQGTAGMPETVGVAAASVVGAFEVQTFEGN